MYQQRFLSNRKEQLLELTVFVKKKKKEKKWKYSRSFAVDKYAGDGTSVTETSKLRLLALHGNDVLLHISQHLEHRYITSAEIYVTLDQLWKITERGLDFQDWPSIEILCKGRWYYINLKLGERQIPYPVSRISRSTHHISRHHREWSVRYRLRRMESEKGRVENVWLNTEYGMWNIQNMELEYKT